MAVWEIAAEIAIVEATRLVLAAAESASHALVEANRPTSVSRVINGQVGAPDDSFRMIGQFAQLSDAVALTSSIISYRYTYMDAVAQFALQTLRAHSPVGGASDQHAGLYRDSHMLFIDGHNVADTTGWLPGQTLFVSNPVPYARKIELGQMKISVPPHIYETCAAIVADAFADSVNVRFTFMPVNFGTNSVGKREFRRLSRRSGNRSERARGDWLAQQPALVITAK